MTDNDSPNLPAGVSLVNSYDHLQTFRGAESAFVAAGWIQPEWLDGLGRYGRQIALDPQGGFIIVHDGRGHRLKHSHKEAGAVAVRRLADGRLQFTRYTPISELRERERLRREEWKREAEATALAKAKQAREEEQDFAARWKKAMARRIDELARLIDRRLVFKDFPDIKLSVHDQARLQSAIDCLRREFDSAWPTIDDLEVKSNVISLCAFARRRLNASR